MCKHQSRILALFLLFGATIVIATPLFACQETCIEFEVSSSKFVLKSFESFDPEKGEYGPIANADVIVRDTAQNTAGPFAICSTKRGPVVKRLRTDSSGRFDLGRIRKGRYWISYIDQARGQSFLVSITGTSKKEPVDLVVGKPGGACYLIDIEHNTTRPPGWTIPVALDLLTTSPQGIRCKNLKMHYGQIIVPNHSFRITRLEPKSSDGVTVDGWNHGQTEVVQSDSNGTIHLNGGPIGPYLIEPNWKSDLFLTVLSSYRELEDCTEDAGLSQVVTEEVKTLSGSVGVGPRVEPAVMTINPPLVSPLPVSECPNENVQPNLVLDRSTHVVGNLRDQTTAPFKKSQIVLQRYEQSLTFVEVKTITTDENGKFDLGVLEAGKYRLLASPHRGFAQPEFLECTSEFNCRMEITLKVNPSDLPYAACPIK